MYFLLFLSALSLHSLLIYEPFDAEALNTRWIPSTNAKFTGNWSLEVRAADYSNGTILGIVPKSPAAYHAISMKKEINVQDGLVLQFENKIQSTSFSCGGSYIKLLNEDFSPPEFNDLTPFVIMFGPDKCGSTNLIQFIYRTKNLKSGVWSEHKLKTAVPGLYDNITHLYTLVIKKDDTFEIKLDNKVKTSGSLHNNDLFDEPFEPPKQILDVTDLKPKDWVDNAEIPDDADTKPADWDEDAPLTIPDATATKPEDWKEEEPLEIPDTTSVKPDDWNEEEDGPFQPALIPNPYCADHGCGAWSPPQVKNPEYKGKWKARMIPNPLYKGEWVQKKVDNPYYFVPEKTLYQAGTIYGLGYELISPVEQWFGAIYVGDSAEEASALAKEHWAPINAAETAAKEAAGAEKKAEKRKELLGRLKKGEGWRDNLETVAELLHDVYEDHTAITITVAVVAVCVFIALIVGCVACCCSGKGNAPEKSAAVEEKEKDDATTKEGEDAEGKGEGEGEGEGKKEEEGSGNKGPEKEVETTSTITESQPQTSETVSREPVEKEKKKEKADKDETGSKSKKKKKSTHD